MTGYDQHSTTSDPSTGLMDGGRGEDPLHGLLLDPKRVKQDIRLLNNAFKGKGPPGEHIEEIWRRLMTHMQTDVVREIDPESGVVILNDRQGADISIKAAGMLTRFLQMYVQDEQAARQEAKDAAKQSAGDTYNIGCVGQIAMGQEPLTPEDAKRQVQEVLARVRARIGVTSPPAERNDVIDVTTVIQKHSGLADA